MPNQTERRFWDFSTSILSQNSKFFEGGTVGGIKNVEKEVAELPKKNWRGTL